MQGIWSCAWFRSGVEHLNSADRYTCMPWGCKYPRRPCAPKVEFRNRELGIFLSLRLCVQASVITPNGIEQERGWYIIIHSVACSWDLSPLTSSRVFSTASRWGLCNAKRRHGLPCLQGSLGNFPPPATRAALRDQGQKHTSLKYAITNENALPSGISSAILYTCSTQAQCNFYIFRT